MLCRSKKYVEVQVMNFFNEILNAAKNVSFSPMLISSGCCGHELILAACSDCEDNLISAETFVNSPRHADLLIIAGPVTLKSVSDIQKIYKQMPEPKCVLAVGNCACSGGVFDSYSVINGVDKIIPVDMFLPMCPPSKEEILVAVKKLKSKVSSQI